MDTHSQEKITCVILLIVAVLLTLAVSLMNSGEKMGKMKGCYTWSTPLLATPNRIYRT